MICCMTERTILLYLIHWLMCFKMCQIGATDIAQWKSAYLSCARLWVQTPILKKKRKREKKSTRLCEMYRRSEGENTKTIHHYQWQLIRWYLMKRIFNGAVWSFVVRNKSYFKNIFIELQHWKEIQRSWYTPGNGQQNKSSLMICLLKSFCNAEL